MGSAFGLVAHVRPRPFSQRPCVASRARSPAAPLSAPLFRRARRGHRRSTWVEEAPGGRAPSACRLIDGLTPMPPRKAAPRRCLHFVAMWCSPGPAFLGNRRAPVAARRNGSGLVSPMGANRLVFAWGRISLLGSRPEHFVELRRRDVDVFHGDGHVLDLQILARATFYAEWAAAARHFAARAAHAAPPQGPSAARDERLARFGGRGRTGFALGQEQCVGTELAGALLQPAFAERDRPRRASRRKTRDLPVRSPGHGPRG